MFWNSLNHLKTASIQISYIYTLVTVSIVCCITNNILLYYDNKLIKLYFFSLTDYLEVGAQTCVLEVMAVQR